MDINFAGLNDPGDKITGAVTSNDVQDLMKALTSGYESNPNVMVGGRALQIQSLDKTLMATIQEEKDFVLFNKLAKSDATATVDEWTEQSSIGGFVGGTSNSELGVINESTGEYARRVGVTKYLMTMRSISLVQSVTNQLSDGEATEQANGCLEIMTDAEHLCFEGDSASNPTEWDGIEAQIRGFKGGINVIDMAGASLNSMIPINNAVRKVRAFQNFGKSTDLLLSVGAQADMDNDIEPTFRVSLERTGKDVQLGAPVTGVKTSHGTVSLANDIFIRDEENKTPFDVRYPAQANKPSNTATQPANAAAAAAVNDVNSKFVAGQAGNYYYAVCGYSLTGGSPTTVASGGAIAVGVGQSVSITIAPSAGGQESGYIVYRSRMNGGNVVTRGDELQSDFREMCRIPKNPAGPTVFVDQNKRIPGTTKAYLLNMTPGSKAITFRRLLPMIRFNLFPTNSLRLPWAQAMFGYLRMTKRSHHIVFDNIVTKGQLWKPFG